MKATTSYLFNPWMQSWCRSPSQTRFAPPQRRGSDCITLFRIAKRSRLLRASRWSGVARKSPLSDTEPFRNRPFPSIPHERWHSEPSQTHFREEAEKTAPVFVVATANDVTALPPEMLRKGRFDNLFFVDLPNETEREAIWAIQIKRYNRKPEDFDLKRLAECSTGMTGSEIEQAFVEALYAGFADGKEPTEKTIEAVVARSVPLSKTMAEQIESLRTWAKTRAQFATSQPRTDPRKPRRISVGIGRN